MKPVRPWCALLAAARLLAAASAPALATTVAEGVFDAGLMRNAAAADHALLATRCRVACSPSPTTAMRWCARSRRRCRARVWFDMFEGDNHRAFGPMESLDQNLLVIVFLQRDVTQMGTLTGGSPNYFQQVRRLFGEPATAEPLEVEVDGKKSPATRYVIHPMSAKFPTLERFAQFEGQGP
ncbi:MAG: hypothetical protein U1E17_14805 [Geminicoccaceae bacterium]